MKTRALLFISLVLLMGCMGSLGHGKSQWVKIKHIDGPGVVSITTAWGLSHMCTGVLITPRVVLSAGHCLGIPPEDLYIVHGCNSISSNNCKRMSVVMTAPHPQYHKRFASIHDLAVLVTAEPIDSTVPAQLYTGKMKQGMTVFAMGFGLRFGKSGILHGGLIRVKRNHTFELVAGRERSGDPNEGDSGGPIYTKDFRLAGILSRSIANDDLPTGFAIYTRPSSYRWVHDIINAEKRYGCMPEDVIATYKHGYADHQCKGLEP